MSDLELEQHVADCGRLMQAAYSRGDRAEAISWLHAQAEAIKGRSAAQVQRMEEGYFGARGAADRRALEAR